MKNLLELKPVVESLELLTIATSKQDVIDVEYDVLDVLAHLQVSSDVLTDEPERNLKFAEARQELVSIIQAKIAEFTVKKPSKHEQNKFSIAKPLLNKRVYRREKRFVYDEEVD